MDLQPTALTGILLVRMCSEVRILSQLKVPYLRVRRPKVKNGLTPRLFTIGLEHVAPYGRSTIRTTNSKTIAPSAASSMLDREERTVVDEGVGKAAGHQQYHFSTMQPCVAYGTKKDKRRAHQRNRD